MVFAADPDRDRAARELRALLPQLVAWVDWLCRARRGPHGAVVVGAPVGDRHGQLAGMGRAARGDAHGDAPSPGTSRHQDRRRRAAPDHDGVPPLPGHRRRPPRRRVGHRAAGDGEPVRGRGPGLHRDRARARPTTSRPRRARWATPTAPLRSTATPRSSRPVSKALWDDDVQSYRAFDVRAGHGVGPATAGGLVALWAGCRPDRAAGARGPQSRAGRMAPGAGVMTSDPDAARLRPGAVLAWPGVGARQLARRGVARAGPATTRWPTHLRVGDARDSSRARASPSTTTRATARASAGPGSRGRRRSRCGGSSASATSGGHAASSGSSSPGSAGVTTFDDGPAAK